jgi:hypothetical protein
MKFFPQGNQEREYPRNLENLHQALKSWFRKNVKTAFGNPIILNASVESTYRVLRGVLSSSTSTEKAAVLAWKNYISSYIVFTQFLPSYPPTGLIHPHIGVIIVSTPIFFETSIKVLDNPDRISYFAASMRSWIASNSTLEFWSMSTPAGPVPAPPVTVPLAALN